MCKVKAQSQLKCEKCSNGCWYWKYLLKVSNGTSACGYSGLRQTPEQVDCAEFTEFPYTIPPGINGTMKCYTNEECTRLTLHDPREIEA